MSTATAVRRIRTELQAMLVAGRREVPIEHFDKWLASLQELSATDPDSVDTAMAERFKANTDFLLADFNSRSQQDLELLRSLVTTGGEATKTSLLINGGSAVALLAFIGHLSTNNAAAISGFVPPLGSFALGVLLAALASSFIYFVQWRFYHRKTVTVPRLTAIAAQALSFAAFLAGCLLSATAFFALAG